MREPRILWAVFVRGTFWRAFPTRSMARRQAEASVLNGYAPASVVKYVREVRRGE